MADYKPIPGKKIFNALFDENIIVMACNIRFQQSAVGIMQAAKQANAAVLFEIAKSEIGYTGQPPAEFAAGIMDSAKELDFDLPYAIHGDHIGIKSTEEKDVNAGAELIQAELDAGFTSFAIDASHIFDTQAATEREQLAGNIEVTTKLGKMIPEQFCLEVEVGEIGKKDPATGKQELTTVAEATAYISALQEKGLKPDLLACHNGTIHGNVYDADGNIVPLLGIDEQRTREIYKAIEPMGVHIAQHGITGTPLELMHKLIDAGVRKGNVGTNWQNILLDNIPPELYKQMEDWTLASEQLAKMKAKKPQMSEKELVGKNIKHSIQHHKQLIAELSDEWKEKINAATKESALSFIKAFNAEDSASKIDY